MHRRDLDLRAKSLDDLDANEIAGLRFDVMRMLVEFGATFNQAAGFASGQRVLINGAAPKVTVVSSTLIEADNIPAPLDDQISVTIATPDATITSTAIVNPLQLMIDKVTVVSYEEGLKGRVGTLKDPSTKISVSTVIGRKPPE